MYFIEMIFSPKNSSKKFKINLSNKEDVKTVFQQFVLSLPLKKDAKNMYLREINGFKLSNKQYISFKNVYAILNAILFNFAEVNYPKLVLLGNSPSKSQKLMLERKENIPIKTSIKAYLLKKNLQTAKSNEKNKSTSHHQSLNDLIFNLGNQSSDLDQDIANTNKSYNEKLKKLNKNKKATISEYQDLIKSHNKDNFALEKRYQDLIERLIAILIKEKTEISLIENGKNDLSNATKRALLDYGKQKTKLAAFQNHREKTNHLERWVHSNYLNYLSTPMSYAIFIKNIIEQINNPNVQNMIKSSYYNLFLLIESLALKGEKLSK